MAGSQGAVQAEQDEDGVWCAHAQLRPGVGANGEGDTPEAAVADLREALEGLITTVPVHQGRDVAKGTLRGILSDVGMTVEELQRLL